MSRPRAPIALVAAALLAAGCGPATNAVVIPGSSAQRGRQLIGYYGCGACHQIDGVDMADGHVGPSLRNFAQRRFIVGELPNTPAQVERWIENPQAIHPTTIMPALGVNAQQAKDIVAYLYEH
jgi:cytochrome c